jgi:hypothetical protein
MTCAYPHSHSTARRIDDARDDVIERLGYTHGHLGGRLDE